MRTVTVDKYRCNRHDTLVVDATQYVPDRHAFTRYHCHRDSGVTHPDAATNGAAVALFCALEPQYSPPRTVVTAVRKDGGATNPTTNETVHAATWALDQVDADDVMLDTFAGTRRASADEDGVAVEITDGPGRPLEQDSRLRDPFEIHAAAHRGAATHVFQTTVPVRSPMDTTDVKDDTEAVEPTPETTAHASR